MSERSPDTIQRLLTLRQYPGFAAADLGELATIAENVEEVTFPAGAIVAPAGRVPPLQLVIDGRIEAARPGGTIAAWGRKQVFGVLEVMAGRPITTAAVATEETRTYQLGAVDFADLLEDNFGLLSSARRALARQLMALDRFGAPRPVVARGVGGSTGAVVPTVRARGLVDRLVALRRQFPLSTGRVQALAALAAASREITWSPGAPVTEAGQCADGLLVILEGAARTTGPARTWSLRCAGQAIGTLETLAERPYGETTTALAPLRALHCPATALLDVTEDHVELALGMVAQLAGELLDRAADA